MDEQAKKIVKRFEEEILATLEINDPGSVATLVQAYSNYLDCLHMLKVLDGSA